MDPGSSQTPVEATIQASDTTTEITEEGTPERWIDLQFTWTGKPFTLSIAESDRVFDFKAALHKLTRVPPERQKILGLTKGNKLPPDQGRIADLRLVTGKKFTLIGTPEGDEIKELEFLPDVVNDLDIDFTEDPVASAAYRNDQRNIRKVKEATAALNVNIIHPLREGKKLLVLDIDYTILDTKPLTSGSLPPDECARPGLHEFLEAIYPYYDSKSQTSWIWLETKLVELGMIGSDRNYQVSTVLDKNIMFQVFTDRDGKPWTHSVKALQIIWNKFPQFNATNTVHVDDLSRNFALNPKEGLKISAFKGAHTREAMADRELWKLSRYMVHIASVDDFRTLSHKVWKDVVRSLPPP
ncbi:HAD subfamily IIID h [Mycena belliarum]|uniref:HAD subfamily IIID h n=1 Tax=Mycena belliarum TaxID=1033014 RepID=A0AAD6XQK8_9AGAR|nr:HAD subfamily IIID h [Mycena belliae]